MQAGCRLFTFSILNSLFIEPILLPLTKIPPSNKMSELSSQLFLSFLCIYFSYVRTTAPKYYAKISPYVDPVLEKTGHYSRVTMTAIYKHSKPVRDFANTHIPPLLQKVGRLRISYCINNKLFYFY